MRPELRPVCRKLFSSGGKVELNRCECAASTRSGEFAEVRKRGFCVNRLMVDVHVGLDCCARCPEDAGQDSFAKETDVRSLDANELPLHRRFL